MRWLIVLIFIDDLIDIGVMDHLRESWGRVAQQIRRRIKFRNFPHHLAPESWNNPNSNWKSQFKCCQWRKPGEKYGSWRCKTQLSRNSTNLSEFMIVLRRWAMVRTVETENSFRIVSWIYVSTSIAAVASSRIKIRLWRSTARARQISWRSPTLEAKTKSTNY